MADAQATKGERSYEVRISVAPKGYYDQSETMLVPEARRFRAQLDAAIQEAERKNRPPGKAFYR